VGWRLVPAAMALSLAGCIPDPLIEEALKPSPTRIEAEVTVAKDVNPDITGKASPVQVRLYELSSAAGFQSAAFFALYDDDRGVLGKDLQARDDILAKPGDRLKITREAKAETKHLALIAAYQDLENATWRAAMPLALTETNAVTIEIGRLAVKIAKKKD
jgi:type VI secretion system protein VasD